MLDFIGNVRREENFLFKVGYFGLIIVDFMKLYGFVVGKNGEYVVIDRVGDDRVGDRVLVFVNVGELIGRFSCNCKISGVIMIRDNLILLVVNGAGLVIMRLYNMDGRVF